MRRWREISTDLAIRSTFIVGFPGETEGDFELLLDWIGEAKLDRVGAFKYEPVTGAIANDLGLPQVPDEVKELRYRRFMEKQQAISAKILANSDARLSPDVSFARGGRVYARPDSLIFAKEEVHLDLGQDLDFLGYETAIAGAAAAAELAGIPRSMVAQALTGFDGFSGRMKIKRLPNQTFFDSSNSGLKVRDVARALDRASGPDLFVVVGEDKETVCEGMNILALSELLRQRKSEMAKLIIVGERLVPLAEELGAATAKNLQQGLEMAQKDKPKRLLSCVKCFR